MKIQRIPLVLLLIALLLGGFVYYNEVQGRPQREAAQARTEQLFQFQEKDVQTLRIKTPQQTLSFVKTPAGRLKQQLKQQLNTKNQVSPDTLIWVMTEPQEVPASDASIAYLLNQMATSKREQALDVAPDRRREFGLDQPLATVEVTLANQQTQTLVLGKPNFNRSALYALINPPANPGGNLSVALVSLDFEKAVTRPLTEWQQEAPAQPAPASKNAPVQKNSVPAPANSGQN